MRVETPDHRLRHGSHRSASLLCLQREQLSAQPHPGLQSHTFLDRAVRPAGREPGLSPQWLTPKKCPLSLRLALSLQSVLPTPPQPLTSRSKPKQTSDGSTTLVKFNGAPKHAISNERWEATPPTCKFWQIPRMLSIWPLSAQSASTSSFFDLCVWMTQHQLPPPSISSTLQALSVLLSFHREHTWAVWLS